VPGSPGLWPGSFTPAQSSKTPAQANDGFDVQEMGWSWAKRQANVNGVLKGV